jgi:hypothetical protein
MSSNNSTYRRFLQLKMITKYGIFGLSFISLLYCILSYLGCQVSWMFIVFFTFAFVLRFILSKAFGLCWVHRTCIMYNYCVSVVIVTKTETMLRLTGLDKPNVIGVLAIIGIIIFSLVVWKVKSNKTC